MDDTYIHPFIHSFRFRGQDRYDTTIQNIVSVSVSVDLDPDLLTCFRRLLDKENKT